MLLSENTEMINKLKIILEQYDFLEYDEKVSQGEDYLQVKVMDLTADRGEDVIDSIHSKLEKATGVKLKIPTVFGYGRGYGDWPYFRIHRISQ